MAKNKRDLLFSNILILITLIWLSINNSSFLEILILFSVFGIIGSIGAVLIDLKFSNIKWLLKYLINTLWIGIFITLSVTYIILTSETLKFLSTQDKIILIGVFSFLPTIISFAIQYVFFTISFIIIVRLKIRKELIDLTDS